MVIVNRLGKGVILVPCENLEAETVARKFIRYFVAYHGIPTAITSDRGTQFVGKLWQRLCEMLRIRRRLSTAHHPETDGQTERMIAAIKEFLRNFCNLLQDNWAELAPAAQLAINSRDVASTGISPFFLDHGYHLELLELDEGIPEESLGRTPKEKLRKLSKNCKVHLISHLQS